MNYKALVKLSNIIGITAILLLVYWVFIFISITVFGLKVFRQNLTETFYLSVVGILALMAGSLIINVMFNLTRIAEKHNQDAVREAKGSTKKFGLIIILSFPLIAALLFGGDYLSSRKKEKMLVASATSIVENNKEKTNSLVAYTFTREWMARTSDILELYGKTDRNFPNVSIIVSDTLGSSSVFLSFYRYYRNEHDTTKPSKQDYIQETTQEERDYLNRVFVKKDSDIRFSASDGRYELFYPYMKNGKTIVLYFSDYQNYGKIGR